MSHTPARNSQLPLLLLVILAATAWGKSPPKQAGDADSVASVAAMKQGDSVVPKDLVPVAIAATKKWCGRPSERLLDETALVKLTYSTGGKLPEKKPNSTCKDYEVSAQASKHLQLTATDRKGFKLEPGGPTLYAVDAWCVTVAFLEKQSRTDPWTDVSLPAYYIKYGGAWHDEADLRQSGSSYPKVEKNSGHC